VPSVGGVFVPRNPAFEAKHPRDRSGNDRGQFIDVPGVMNGLGAHFDAERGAWMVPVERSEDLKQMSRDTGLEMMSVPKGMRPLRSRGALASEVDPETGLPDPKIAADAELEKRLAIPPAWTDVLVATDPNADVLAVGRDEKGRRQTTQNLVKQAQRKADSYVRLRKLDEKMGSVDHRLSQEASDDDTAAAMMVVRKMGLRPGSTKNTGADQYAYGASTLERRHVAIEGDTVHLEFDSKKGGHTVVSHEDAELAAVLKVRLAGKAGGDRIFPKTNDRKMNKWVKETAGDDYTVKDFRTHLGTSVAAALVADMPEPMTAKEYRQQQLTVGGKVSKILGNTREESLKSYIDPAVFGPVPGDAPKASEVPGETGRAMLKQAFDAGHHAGDDLTGGRSALAVKRVTLSDGTQAVLKTPPDAGEHRREIASGIVANALGVDDVHVIDAGDGQVLATLVPGEPGGIWSERLPAIDAYAPDTTDEVRAARQTLVESGMRFSLAVKSAHVLTMPGAKEIGVLDFLIRNRDRHELNWMSDGERIRPIDHGLTFFGTEGADRDVPYSPFSEYWLGLSQKRTPRPAAGKSNTDARTVKGPKVKVAPKVSKAYLQGVRTQLEAARSEFTDEEWDGFDARLQILEQAAPETIPGEVIP
jgi:DNA topoisomerase-1